MAFFDTRNCFLLCEEPPGAGTIDTADALNPLMGADIETKDVLRKTISASRELAQLNGALWNLPNPTLFLDTIYLQEAKASSEVENIITTNDELYKSLVAERKAENSAIKEVLSYKEALWLGLDQLKKNRSLRLIFAFQLCNASNKTKQAYGLRPELRSVTPKAKSYTRHQRAKK